MKFNLSSPFRFATGQVAVLAVLLYAAVFVSVLVTDELSATPKKTEGLDLERAYEALSTITTRPRPYISHANDDVRAYIVSRLQPLAKRHDYIHLSDDMSSNVTYVSARGQTAIYFEGTNVLLKIDGTDSPLASPETSPDGVLFSCHYDSVSTAPGATDDGMGVATLLELAEYFSIPERRPRRTAIFFFNNGEEDYLNGAHAYYAHPWSNLTSAFINLEGAASGGRPVIFRSTSYGAARSLVSSSVKHPHGNTLTSDAFSAGMIRSATDYEVYAQGVEGEVAGMHGIDFAFYKNRAYYHTPRDTIAGMGSGQGRKALWAMMETARGAGLSMLNDDRSNTDERKSVYFDLFGHALLLFPMEGLYIFNIVLMVIGPLSTVGLMAWLMLAAKEQSTADEVVTRHQGLLAKLKLATKVIAGWERFWVSLVVAALVHAGLITGFVFINPYVIHSHGYAVMTIFLALSFLALVVPLQSLHYLLPPTFTSQKLAVSLSLYSFTWILLLVSTLGVSLRQVGSLYWTTVLNLCTWLACILELQRAIKRRDPGNETGRRSELFTSPAERAVYEEGAVPARRLVSGVLYEAPPHVNGDDMENGVSETDGEVVTTSPTEITPLMHQHRRASYGGHEHVTMDPPDAVAFARRPAEEYGWWIAQMVLLVPATAILVFQLEVMLLNALMHTLVDGSSPVLVYEVLALLSVLIFVPLTPFAHKLPQALNAAVAIIFVVLLVVCWIVFPFTQEWPFRVYFQQSVELSSPSLAVSPPLAIQAGTTSSISQRVNAVRAETTLTGLTGYLDKYIVPGMPSARTTDVHCNERGLRPDLMTCKWTSDLLPSPGGSSNVSASSTGAALGAGAKWLDVAATRVNATRARIAVRGANTRGCRLYLDRPVSYVYTYPQSTHAATAQHGDALKPAPAPAMHLQPGYGMPREGVKEVRLWSRTWDREFVVELGWEDVRAEDGEVSKDGLSGRAACEYAEYESALGGPAGGRIPALEEVKTFLPLWALPTKLADGLVEVWTRFAV